MIESTYSVSSFSGLVSSKRRFVCPPNSSASPKSRQIALACPMCRYPLGSGGKRVCTRPEYLLVFRSSRMMSRMKFEGRDSGGMFAPFSASVSDVFITTDLIAKKGLSDSCRDNLAWSTNRHLSLRESVPVVHVPPAGHLHQWLPDRIDEVVLDQQVPEAVGAFVEIRHR